LKQQLRKPDIVKSTSPIRPTMLCMMMFLIALLSCIGACPHCISG